jgi:DNA (cytosine-5)-methyltransferase 1
MAEELAEPPESRRTFGSLFAGAGGIDLGFERAGWECRWQVEIDPHAQMVERFHWPDIYRAPDVTQVDGRTLEPVDVIVGGFPCQDLSVAGNRAGMVEGTRSGLFFEFVRIVEEMRNGTAGSAPRWVVWENVPGLLSLGDTLGNCYAAWDGIGAVVQEHRLVDAQFFGVPQRRRRVFGVACFDPGAESFGPVLPDPDGLRRNPAPCRSEGEDPAGSSPAGARGGGVLADSGIVSALAASFGAGGPDAAHAQNGWLVPDIVQDVTGTLSPGAHPGGFNGQDAYNGMLVPSVLPFDTTNLTSPGNYSCPKPGDPSHPLAATAHPPAVVLSFDSKFSPQTEIHRDISPTLKTVDVPAAASDQGGPVLAVRRLTPVECERLMGWDDAHTAYGVTEDGETVEMSDAARYRLCGNGVVAQCAEWVAQRIDRADPDGWR